MLSFSSSSLFLRWRFSMSTLLILWSYSSIILRDCCSCLHTNYSKLFTFSRRPSQTCFCWAILLLRFLYFPSTSFFSSSNPRILTLYCWISFITWSLSLEVLFRSPKFFRISSLLSRASRSICFPFSSVHSLITVCSRPVISSWLFSNSSTRSLLTRRNNASLSALNASSTSFSPFLSPSTRSCSSLSPSITFDRCSNCPCSSSSLFYLSCSVFCHSSFWEAISLSLPTMSCLSSASCLPCAWLCSICPLAVCSNSLHLASSSMYLRSISLFSLSRSSLCCSSAWFWYSSWAMFWVSSSMCCSAWVSCPCPSATFSCSCALASLMSLFISMSLFICLMAFSQRVCRVSGETVELAMGTKPPVCIIKYYIHLPSSTQLQTLMRFELPPIEHHPRSEHYRGQLVQVLLWQETIRQSFYMPQLRVTIVPRQIGELWDEILEGALGDICRPPSKVPDVPLQQLIPHRYYPTYGVRQGECYQQYTSNLCGYHACFNTLCFLHLLNRTTTHYHLQSPAAFWSFKKKVELFLREIKQCNRLKDEWPWREKDILYGDFERTYNQVCLDCFDEFDIFRHHNNFDLFSFTWEFQYRNLVISDQRKLELTKAMNSFKGYTGAKPVVMSFMLGITNHWMCLLAVKSKGQAQYWFFDSFNRHILEMDQREMLEEVERTEKERIRIKGEGFTPFYKEHLPICWADTQVSVKLIVDCLQGRTTLDHYIYNQQFNIFADKLQPHWDTDLAKAEHVLKDYWHNIYSFFRVPLKFALFTPNNQRRFNRMLHLSLQLKPQSDYGTRLYSSTKKYHSSHMQPLAAHI